MAAAGDVYASLAKEALLGNVRFLADAVSMALLSSSYSSGLGTQSHWSDVVADEISGTGYTAGGVQLTSPSATTTEADSWGTVWASQMNAALGQVIRPSAGNGYLYQAVVAGQAGTSEPSFSTVVGETTVDGGITWLCAGTSITVFSGASVQWTNSTITASFAVLYDATAIVGVPSQPSVTVVGTAGTTSYWYIITAVANDGSESEGSPAGSTATGNATLSSTNKNDVAGATVAGAVTYNVYKSTTSATAGFALLASGLTSPSVSDTGQATSAGTPPANQDGVMPLLALFTFAQSTSDSAGTFEVSPDPDLGFFYAFSS